MKAADLFVRCLEREGVEYVFAVPGEENLDLLESLRSSGIRVVVNRHEQGSAFMASAYARLTGKTGVCMATLGPGATNLITGIAHAQLCGIPLVAITGQKGIRENWQADFQVLDVVNMMKPITKRAIQIQGPKQIAKEIRDAFKVATTERLGACHIELPEDIAKEDVDEEIKPLAPGVIRRPDAGHKAVCQAAERIRNARHPVVIVSSRGQRRRVHEKLRQFCDTTNIYVIHTQLGKGVLGDDHPNSLFAFGIHKYDYVNCVVSQADLIITLGYSTLEHPPSLWNRTMDKEILHVDFTPAKTEIYYNPCVELIGDIGSSLDMLAAELRGYRYDSTEMERMREQLVEKLFVEGADDGSFPLKPRRIVADVRKYMDSEDIVCMDNGIYKLWFSRHYPTFNIGTFLLDNTLATMGAGLPMAMGAKLIHPEKRVLGIVGDGGFMMNAQELETAMRLSIPIVILILNDNGYGFIKWKQRNSGFADFGLDLGNPDFVAFAECHGARGFRIESADELIPKMDDAFRCGVPSLVECPIDYRENIEVWNKELDRITCRLR